MISKLTEEFFNIINRRFLLRIQWTEAWCELDWLSLDIRNIDVIQ